MQLNSIEESTFVGPGSSGRQHERDTFLAGLARRPEKATLMGNKGMRSPKDGLRADESSGILAEKILGLTLSELQVVMELRIRIAQEIVDALNMSGTAGGVKTDSTLATCTEMEQGRITLEMMLNHPSFTLDIFIAEYLREKK